jgi:hypothetical protein
VIRCAVRVSRVQRLSAEVMADNNKRIGEIT